MKIVETLTKVIVTSFAVVGIGLGAALAQSTAPAPSPGAAPGQVKPDLPPSADPSGKPSMTDEADPSAAGSTAPSPGATTAPGASGTGSSAAVKSGDMVGLPVVGSDGKAIGSVAEVKSASDGKLSELHIKTGSILGFGGTIVKVPADQVAGSTAKEVKLSMTYDRFKKLVDTSVQ